MSGGGLLWFGLGRSLHGDTESKPEQCNDSKSLYQPLCLLMSIGAGKLYLQRLKHKADNLSMDN